MVGLPYFIGPARLTAKYYVIGMSISFDSIVSHNLNLWQNSGSDCVRCTWVRLGLGFFKQSACTIWHTGSVAIFPMLPSARRCRSRPCSPCCLNFLHQLHKVRSGMSDDFAIAAIELTPVRYGTSKLYLARTSLSLF